MDLSEIGFGLAVLVLVFQYVVKPIIEKKMNGNKTVANDPGIKSAESAALAAREAAQAAKILAEEIKKIQLDYWSDTKNRLDQIKDSGTSERKDLKTSVDWMYKQLEALDTNKYPLMWRNEEKDRKNHDTLANLLQLQGELIKTQNDLLQKYDSRGLK